ncbi:hypothetical protein ACOSQ2_027303 [Xanthoceras sorbifolium]
MNEDFIYHLFIHCVIAYRLWVILIKEGKIMWVIPASCGSLQMENMHASGQGDKAKVLWNCVALPLLRVIWQERNSIIFEQNKRKTLSAYGIESNS